MPDRIPVAFEGEGFGVGELTWGQQHIWRAIRETGSSLSMGAIRILAEGATVEEFAGELRFYMSRFQSMRTRLRFEPDGRPVQVVASAGEAALEIEDAGDADPALVAEQVFQRHQDEPFDYENEWPLRMTLVRQHGALTHLVTTLCHLATDAAGAFVMFTDLLERNRLAGELADGHLPPVTAVTPLEQARLQATPAGRRQSDAALRYMEGHLRTIVARRFRDPAGETGSRFRQVRYESRAMHLAVTALASRMRVDAAPVYLAAFAVALARVTGNNPVVTQLVVSNRFRPGFADMVSPVNQTGLCVIDVADAVFDEVVLRARTRAISAYKHAYYDPAQLSELIARIRRERGEDVDRSCVYNDRRPQDSPVAAVPSEGEMRAALPRSVLRWEKDLDRFNGKLMVNVNGGRDTMDVMAQADTRYVPQPDLEALLRGMETVTVDAAFDPASPTQVTQAPAHV